MENLINEPEVNEEEIIDELNDETVVAPVQYDITSYGADYDVEGIVKRLNRDDILIPPFQRNYVWNQREASRFIESLLLGLPVPGVFLVRERDSNKLLVIDGQQRLKTLQFFYNGYFNPKEGEKKSQIFKLVEVQPKFEGQTYKSLDEPDRVRLNDSLIHATIIKQESPKDDDTSIYHIFDRLNSQGRRLTPQEIRTAIHHGPFIDLIKKINEHPNWRNIYGRTSARLKDQELILRFLAMCFAGDEYTKPMNEFLNTFCEKHRSPGQDFLHNARSVFVSNVDLFWNSVGKQSFKPVSSLNAAVFDSVMVGLARRIVRDPQPSQDAVKEAYTKLLSDTDYLRAVSQSTADENNVTLRLRKAVDAFGGI